jgi:hypothetical protein
VLDASMAEVSMNVRTETGPQLSPVACAAPDCTGRAYWAGTIKMSLSKFRMTSDEIAQGKHDSRDTDPEPEKIPLTVTI